MKREKLKVRAVVTKDDINNGIKMSEHNCPIARALKRELPNFRPVVLNDAIKLICRTSKHVYECPTPKRAWNFIRKFDASKDVKPMVVNLTLVGKDKP